VAASLGMRVVVGSSLCVLMLSACPAVEPLNVPPDCNPLAHTLHCGLPYPSDHFLVDDPSLPSGKRVEIGRDAELLPSSGRSGDITDFIAQDGFSRHAPIVFTLGVRIDGATLPGISDDPAATTAAGFGLALLRASDGARVPFFVDVDPRATDDARQAIIMRPLKKLDEQARYIVAISGVVDTSGAAAPVPEGFRRLRDGAWAVGEDPILKPLLTRFDAEVFPAVEAAGIARASLQLAWDFTTGSDAHITHDMLRARTLVLDELARTPPTAAVDTFFEDDDIELLFDDRPENAWRFVLLRVTGPRVVESDQPGTLLARDDAGEVRLNGTTTFDVTAIIPASVRDGDAAGPPLLYGHGFFGDQNEVEFGSTRHMANELGRVVFALNWVGMSLEDVGVVSGGVGNQVNESLRFGERVPQAMMNWLTLTELVAAGGLDDLTFDLANTTVTPFRRPDDNAAVVGRDDFVFIGISQGHILGGVHAALNTRVRRVTLHAGGSAFSHMMFRARPFEGFLFFLDRALPDPLDQQVLTAHLQRGYDRFDPATYAPYVNAPLPEGPDNGGEGRRVLLQVGRGDAQVPNLGAFLHARYLGVPFVLPSAITPPADLPTTTAPHEGSGIYVFDMGVDPSFEEQANIPPEENVVHDSLRSTREAVAQMRAFLNDGVIVDPCGGAGCGVVR